MNTGSPAPTSGRRRAHRPHPLPGVMLGLFPERTLVRPTLALCLLGLFFLEAPPLAAQEDRGTVGFFLGKTSSRQLWSGSIGSERIQGLSVGVFVDVQTPLPALSIRAEAGYAGRGTIVWDDLADPERTSEAKVRSHYLSLPVHGKAQFRFGPFSGYGFAGPTLEYLLSSGCSTQFCQVIQEENMIVLSVGGGFGIGLDLFGRYRAGIEVRFTEGLNDAYVGALDAARNRSTEILVRMGIPL